jgi:hypothetical protein
MNPSMKKIKYSIKTNISLLRLHNSSLILVLALVKNKNVGNSDERLEVFVIYIYMSKKLI